MQKTVSLPMDPKSKSDIDLIALMQAFNDLNTATRLLLESEDAVVGEQISQNISGAERAYLFRLICGHLNEGLNVFVRFARHENVKEVVAKFDPEQKRVFEKLCCESGGQEGLRCKYLKPIRNQAAFHYNESHIQKAFEKLVAEGKPFDVIVAQKYKDVRYLAADAIIAAAFKIHVGDLYEHLQFFVGRVRDVQVFLMRFIDFYLAHSGKAAGAVER